jgi:hypothetical protein
MNSPKEAKMDQIEKIVQRPLLYNNIDGTGEIGTGFLFLGYALLQWISIHLPEASIWHQYRAFLGFALLITTIHFGVKAIKKHITYPRTGYVEYRKRSRTCGVNWGGMAIGAGVGALFGVGIALVHRSHWGMTTLAALFGLVLAAGYAWRIANAVRWKWAVAAVMAICSLVLAKLPAGLVGTHSWSTMFPDNFEGAWLFSMMLYGTIILISGGISFVLYLRHTQPAAETAE